MARAVRPVVILMLLATILFVADGILDHGYVNQPLFDEYKGVGWTSFAFAVANLLVAIAVARGSERTLLGRIALSAFFIIERPLTAFVLGDKSPVAIAVHFATAVVEMIILIEALRIWRLGHSVVPGDMEAMFALDGPGAATADPSYAPYAATPAVEPARRSGSSAWLIGVLTLILAAILVLDGIVAGFWPGGREWGLAGDSSGWLVYLFAVVILTVATRAVHGGRVAQRLLMALALIFFVERSFSPFALKVIDPVRLGLHGVAAFVALTLAVAVASAIRNGDGRPAASRRASPAT